MRLLVVTPDAALPVALASISDEWEIVEAQDLDQAKDGSVGAAAALVDFGTTERGLEASEVLYQSGVTIPHLVIGDVSAENTRQRIVVRPFTLHDLVDAIENVATPPAPAVVELVASPEVAASYEELRTLRPIEPVEELHTAEPAETHSVAVEPVAVEPEFAPQPAAEVEPVAAEEPVEPVQIEGSPEEKPSAKRPRRGKGKKRAELPQDEIVEQPEAPAADVPAEPQAEQHPEIKESPEQPSDDSGAEAPGPAPVKPKSFPQPVRPVRPGVFPKRVPFPGTRRQSTPERTTEPEAPAAHAAPIPLHPLPEDEEPARFGRRLTVRRTDERPAGLGRLLGKRARGSVVVAEKPAPRPSNILLQRVKQMLEAGKQLESMLEEVPALGQPRMIARTFLEELVDLFGPETGGVYALGTDGTYRVVAGHNLTNAECEMHVPANQALFVEISTGLQGVLIAPLDLAQGLVAGIGGARTEALIAAPLVSGDTCHGIVVLGRKDFADHELDRLSDLAAEAAPSFAFAHLIERLRTR